MNPEDLGNGIRERTPIRGKVVSGMPLFRPLIWLVGTHGFQVGSRGSGVREGRGVHGSGSAGPGLRSQGSSGKGTLSRCARGAWVIASRARSGPIPLLPVAPEMGSGKELRFWIQEIRGAAAPKTKLFHRFRNRPFTVLLDRVLR